MNRINKIYNMALGLLGGMAVMHLFFIASQPNKDTFVTTYAPFANTICAFTQILTNFTLVFGFALSLIYRQKSNEKFQNLDPNRLEFRQHFVLGVVTQMIVFVAWIILNIMPKYTNKFTFFNTSEITESDFVSFRILCYLTDVLMLVAWVVASVYNKAQIEGLEIDPDDDGEERDSTEADEGNEEDGAAHA